MDLLEARRILVCLRYGIGDVVMELPVLEALRRAAPRARITALGAAPAVELLEGDPRVDEVDCVASWGLSHRWDEGTAASREALGRWIDRGDFDRILDVHHAVVAVARTVWGRGIESLEADEGAEEAAVAAGRDGVAAIKAAVRSGWGLDVPEADLPRLYPTAGERAAAAAILEPHLGDAPAPIGISPVASLPMKRWPTERFAAAADRLVEETGRSVLLLEGPQDRAGDAVAAAMRRVDRLIRVGSLHLRRTAALLERCAVFLCNDTGIMHMAAAVGTPVVGIFGPTAPGIYLPPAPNAQGLVGREIVCPHRNTLSLQPPGCWNADRCLIAEHSCVREVSVEEVVGAGRRALEELEGSVSRGPRAGGSALDPAAA